MSAEFSLGLLRERIASRIRLTDGGCWIWTGTGLPHGYGTGWYEGRNWRMHTLTYTLFVGPVPAGLQLDHLCHSQDDACPGGRACVHRRCCFPGHLEAVTPQTNSRRSAASRRTTCPQGHELTPENKRIDAQGARHCRPCQREDAARRAASPDRFQAVRLCDCGCGQPTLRATRSISAIGQRRGQPLSWLPHHNLHASEVLRAG